MKKDIERHSHLFEDDRYAAERLAKNSVHLSSQLEEI